MGRGRTEAKGLSIDWEVADVTVLPRGDGAFDVVTSAFGPMFATLVVTARRRRG